MLQQLVQFSVDNTQVLTHKMFFINGLKFLRTTSLMGSNEIEVLHNLHKIMKTLYSIKTFDDLHTYANIGYFHMLPEVISHIKNIIFQLL